MPFPKQQLQSFTQADVEKFPKGQMGCYGLRDSARWIYVGKGDIFERLSRHLGGDKTCIKLSRPTHFVYVVTADYDEEEKRLIEELNPVCNQRVGWTSNPSPLPSKRPENWRK